MEANRKSSARAREKLEFEVSGMHSIFYVQIFQLLKDIASKNHDVHISNSNRNEVRIGATTLGAAGGALIGGIVGSSYAAYEMKLFGIVLGGTIGATAVLFFSKPASIASVTFSKMDEKEKQLVARIAIQVAC